MDPGILQVAIPGLRGTLPTPKNERLGSLPNRRAPSISMITTLGPKVCKCYLFWAIWSLRAS